MSHFSNGWGAPSCRQEENSNRRCRGRRRGKVATCRARLKGWVENVAARSPIWGDVDLEAFCRKTGYSREHATRELSKLRREGGLAFETKLRSKNGKGRKVWGVIVADPAKLRFDKRSLFYDRRGRRLHNYTTLANGGEKIEPTVIIQPAKRPRGRPRRRVPPSPATGVNRGSTHGILNALTGLKTSRLVSAENHRVCDNANIREDSYGIQQPEQYGAKRDIALWRDWSEGPATRKKVPTLRKKAFAMLESLAACHWDNCKVTFARRTAYRFALSALTDGHEKERIVSCYVQALFLCHGFAVDQAASTGKITFFNLSSTVVKARHALCQDGLTRRQRIVQWYLRHPRREPRVAHDIDPEELARIHAQAVATFPAD